MSAKSKKKKGGTLLSLLGDLLSAPVSFLGGLMVGLITPVAAVAGIVGGVYLFTKKVPCFSQTTPDETIGERSLTLKLTSPDKARAAFEGQLAELKEAWARIAPDLAEITRQADEETPSEETAAEPQP